jgi:hypothetical protein
MTPNEMLAARKIWFLVDDYGNQWRFVETVTGIRFWGPAPNKKIHALFMSWGDVDDWGSPLDWDTYAKEKK